MACVTRSGLVLRRREDIPVKTRSRSARASGSAQLEKSLLDMPEDVLQQILAVLESSQEGEVPHGKVADALAAFRCVSKAAKKLVDGAVKNVRFDVGNFARREDLYKEQRVISVLREDLCRWPKVADLSLHLLPVWEFAFVDRCLPLVAAHCPHLRHLTVSGDVPHLKSRQFRRFHHLQTLTLSKLPLQTSNFASFASLPSLHTLTLHLSNSRSTNIHIPVFPRLRQLSIQADRGSNPQVRLASSADAPWCSLHTLTLEWCTSTAPWTPPAAAFPVLSTLRLLRSPIREPSGVVDVHLLTSLRELSLGIPGKTTSRTIAHLSKNISTLHGLRSLHISKMSLGALCPLDHLTSLEALTVRHARATTLRQIATLSTLRSLHIDLWGSYGEVLVPLATIANFAPPLEALHLSHCTLGGEDLPALTKLQTLSSLTLLHLKTSNLPPLGNLSGLQHLCLKDLRLDAPACLGDLLSLRTLEVKGFRLLSFTEVARLTSLEVLHLRSICKTIAGPLNLKSLHRLRSLTLQSVHGLTSVKGLENLRALETFVLLDRHEAPDLAQLTALVGLRRLEVRRTCHWELPPLGGLTALESLVLSRLCIGKPIVGLELCGRLKRVHLHEGAASCIGWLGVLPRLEEVWLEDLPKGVWVFSSPGGQRVVVKGGGLRLEKLQLRKNLRAFQWSLVAAGMVEMGEAEGKSGNDDKDEEDEDESDDEYDDDDIGVDDDEEDDEEEDEDDDDEDDNVEDEDDDHSMGAGADTDDDEGEASDDDDMETDEDEENDEDDDSDNSFPW